jgi:hypothetical protein
MKNNFAVKIFSLLKKYKNRKKALRKFKKTVNSDIGGSNFIVVYDSTIAGQAKKNTCI